MYGDCQSDLRGNCNRDGKHKSKGECALVAIYESINGRIITSDDPKFRKRAREHPDFESWDQDMKDRLSDLHEVRSKAKHRGWTRDEIQSYASRLDEPLNVGFVENQATGSIVRVGRGIDVTRRWVFLLQHSYANQHHVTRLY